MEQCRLVIVSTESDRSYTGNCDCSELDSTIFLDRPHVSFAESFYLLYNLMRQFAVERLEPRILLTTDMGGPLMINKGRVLHEVSFTYFVRVLLKKQDKRAKDPGFENSMIGIMRDHMQHQADKK